MRYQPTWRGDEGEGTAVGLAGTVSGEAYGAGTCKLTGLVHYRGHCCLRPVHSILKPCHLEEGLSRYHMLQNSTQLAGRLSLGTQKRLVRHAAELHAQQQLKFGSPRGATHSAGLTSYSTAWTVVGSSRSAVHCGGPVECSESKDCTELG